MQEKDLVIQLFKSKLSKEDSVTVSQGDAMDLSIYPDDLFDITLCLGPMYHLFDDTKKRTALEEAVDNMDNETFQLYLKYHLSICERKDLIGASNHTLDILCKR